MSVQSGAVTGRSEALVVISDCFVKHVERDLDVTRLQSEVSLLHETSHRGWLEAVPHVSYLEERPLILPVYPIVTKRLTKVSLLR